MKEKGLTVPEFMIAAAIVFVIGMFLVSLFALFFQMLVEAANNTQSMEVLNVILT